MPAALIGRLLSAALALALPLSAPWAQVQGRDVRPDIVAWDCKTPGRWHFCPTGASW